MKEKSYTELMKISAMNRHNQVKVNFIQNLFIEMLLTEIQLTSEKEKLLEKIDMALDNRNKNEFLLLSKQYSELNKRFGN